MKIEELLNRITQLERRLEQMQDEQHAVIEVLGWLLARHPDDAEMYLACQANDWEESPKLAALTPTFDELRTHLAFWREQQ